MVWADSTGVASKAPAKEALQSHRALIFGKGSVPAKGHAIDRKQALQVLESENAVLPKAAVLRCRVRYFTDGAILGSAEFVRGYLGAWQLERGRKHPPKVNAMKGAEWGDLSVIQALRRQVFG